MGKAAVKAGPPDQLERDQALDASRSIIVQAPAGSGKTTLLAQRFLTLLAEVEEPGQVVAITFTNAAAAEMRNRILDELRAQEPNAIALRALEHSIALGWKLLDLPAQLRISTIDSFCRELALQQPLLSGLGGGLAVAEQPDDLYRRAAQSTMELIGRPGSAVGAAVETILDWRDNNWQELEDLLVEMLQKRDRWMQEFVLSRNPDWNALRDRLERPFARAVRDGVERVNRLLGEVPGACDEALALARFACSQPEGDQHRDLAEMAGVPRGPFLTSEELEEALHALLCLGRLVLTKDGGLRRRIDKTLGFPADCKPEKARLTEMIADLGAVDGLAAALAGLRDLPPVRYSEADWEIVRACFTLLRDAAAQLRVIFAEAGAVDFVEVAQIAQGVLKAEDGSASDAAMAVADGIRHLLVDEFQDTSRRQHQLLAGLIAAWPDMDDRTLFTVGDPMQSIYFFRDADAELFARVGKLGLEIPNAEPLKLLPVPLRANFRTAPSLVGRLNEIFQTVFAEDDGSGIVFSPAIAARGDEIGSRQHLKLHIDFILQASSKQDTTSETEETNLDPQAKQAGEIVGLIQDHLAAMELTRAAGGKYRIAVLGRARNSLVPIAKALHEAGVPFRAVDLEGLASRPEVLDALALARALLNAQDRVAWLGVLRAPWCGLVLGDLHILTSADDPTVLARPIPELMAERFDLLSPAGQVAVGRVVSAVNAAPVLRASQPTASLGTLLQQVWLLLGGAGCCDATATANLEQLWSCLDKLPGGEQDLLGPTLDGALNQLTALPDPDTSSDCGVQLMTIHKSKGLEFEVVIVPDLQARTGGSSRKMLSWLERGLKAEADPDSELSGEITEFLIAPLPSKGEDSGLSKKWVDKAYREREAQETRRILYVAATRAREELHLFARVSYKTEADGELTLINPLAGLLTTAWPALEAEVLAQFEAWKQAGRASEGEIASIAASDSNLFVMPVVAAHTPRASLLRRLPDDYATAPMHGAGSAEAATPAIGETRLYRRHEGGMVSRALGTAVHGLLEELARLRLTADWSKAREAVAAFEPRIAAQIRGTGIPQTQAAPLAAEALRIALAASEDPTGRWILSPHTDADSEVQWAGIADGAVTGVRVDRVFRAGATPLTRGQDAWWIVDYKTAHEDGLDPAEALPRLRPLFAQQLEVYGRILRALHGADAAICAGLYYPRMGLFDWWQL